MEFLGVQLEVVGEVDDFVLVLLSLAIVVFHQGFVGILQIGNLPLQVSLGGDQSTAFVLDLLKVEGELVSTSEDGYICFW